MPENWYALCAAILYPTYLRPEQALELIGCRIKGATRRPKKNFDVVQANIDAKEMIKLKKDHTYAEIGKMYGVCATTAFKRVKRHEEMQEIKKRLNKKPKSKNVQ